ncbi:hypothetical protein AAHH71_06685 [Bacillus toyonensis]
MLDSPFWGIGAFNFPQYNLYFYGKEMYMHNTFLEVLTESGLMGIMLYTIFCLSIMFTVLKRVCIKISIFTYDISGILYSYDDFISNN